MQVSGCWSLAAGYWLLAGHWFFLNVTRIVLASRQKLAASSQRLEVLPLPGVSIF